MVKRSTSFVALLALATVIGALWGNRPEALAQSPPVQSPSLFREIRAPSERLEMTVNESRILTLSPSLTKANRIPQAQVNNREVLEITPLSPTQIQVFAKKPGVTQVNIWNENNEIYAVDVIVYGDARELAMLLQSEFPNASLRVKPIASGVLISGYVDQPDDVSSIVEISREYYPKVLTNIRVGGVHQVLLHVKAMEVSRTKLRQLGLDWALVSPNTFTESVAAGLLKGVTRDVIDVPGGGDAWGYTTGTSGTETFRLSVINGPDAFFAVLDALRQDSLMKILAEPTLVTVSGRPAFFQVGGEVPTLVPAGLGVVSIEYKRYGTQVDFVPIVLGNGRIRLEVRPRVSDIDSARSITLDGQTIYAFNTREVDTGVELQAGQTLAIAGLVQHRLEAQRRGIPWLSELPYVGVAFRRVEERVNEIELLILVTPELVEAVDADQVPPGGPGTDTCSPNDWELYMRGYLEVPCCQRCGHQCGGRCSGGGQSAEEVPGLLMPADEPVHPGEEILLPEEISSPQPSTAPATSDQSARKPKKASQAARQSPTTLRTPRTIAWDKTRSSRPVAASAPRPPTAPSARAAAIAKSGRTATPDTATSQPSGELHGLIGPIGYDTGAQ